MKLVNIGFGNMVSAGRIVAMVDVYKRQDLDVASEFLEMASRLVYIKTVYLLPKHEEAEALEKELVGQLLEYQICKEMAGKFGKLLSLDRFVREPQDVYKRQVKGSAGLRRAQSAV